MDKDRDWRRGTREAVHPDDPLHPRNHPLTTAMHVEWDNAQEDYMRSLMRVRS